LGIGSLVFALGKRLAGTLVNSIKASELLPPTYDRVDVTWFELNAIANAPDALGSDNCRTAPEERIKHNISACSAI
jgi:hypothetical protein